MQSTNETETTLQLPELLAPAGSLDSLYAAVENGADAVYFGLAGPEGFNARNRAENISLEKLGDTTSFLRSRNVKGYVTLNTLVRSDELPAIESLLRQIAEARVDAVLVQDFGLARLARRFCPDLVLHASTQMSLTSQRAVELAASLGIRRVVLPRELSLRQIEMLCKMLDESSGLELECFVHGALCISFSGQCYASLALGGRSANRGRCAQPCRMSYELLDGENNRSITTSKQLLSPCDLAALPLLPKLVATGIRSLKIEGRLKPPEYVAEVTRSYRQALDQIAETPNTASAAEPSAVLVEQDLERLALTFSRGFSTGWLEGVEPRRLVPGNIMSHRGTQIGTVIEIRRDAAVVRLTGAVRRGDGILFENKTNPEQSQGGRVYEIFQRRESVQQAEAGAKVLLTFANNSIDPEFVREGQSVQKTDDPKLQREIRRSLEQALKSSAQTTNRVPLNIDVQAFSGMPIHISVQIFDKTVCRLQGDSPLEIARKHPLSLEILREQFNRLGETNYVLGDLTATIRDNPMVPLSVLGKLRRKMIEQLDAIDLTGETDPFGLSNFVSENVSIRFGDSLKKQRAENDELFKQFKQTASPSDPSIKLLLRDVRWFEDSDLLNEILRNGCRSFYVEAKTVGEYKFAAEAIRRQNAEFVAVLPRIIKPGESRVLGQIAKFKPDAVLVRNLEELAFFRAGPNPVSIIADFSLNVVNDLSFRQLLDWGVERITPGWDAPLEESRKNESALEDFVRQVPLERIERIIVGRLPLFTMEHCLWRGNLTKQGESCNRICRTQPLKIRDRRGALHTVRSDLLCRNIVENSEYYRLESAPDRWKHLRIEWDERLGDKTPLETLLKLNENRKKRIV